jgi:hypothetical protein
MTTTMTTTMTTMVMIVMMMMIIIIMIMMMMKGKTYLTTMQQTNRRAHCRDRLDRFGWRVSSSSLPRSQTKGMECCAWVSSLLWGGTQGARH